MKKKTLEMKLQALTVHSSDVELEQYNTPAAIAADILCLAYSYGDIGDRKVIDLGCGNGIFAIGAKLLGAGRAIGVDVDGDAIETAEENAMKMDVDVEFVNCDVSDFVDECDTVLQNPPFGAQRSNKHADMVFIRKAFEVARVVYSLHLAKTAEFVVKCIESCAANLTLTKSYKFPILHTYKFHTKERRDFDVVMMRGTRHEKG